MVWLLKSRSQKHFWPRNKQAEFANLLEGWRSVYKLNQLLLTWYVQGFRFLTHLGAVIKALFLYVSFIAMIRFRYICSTLMHSLFHLLYTEANWTGLDFIIKDLPSVLILRITANQILINLLCCSYKYNWCLCRFINKLYILLWTLLEILSVISIFVHKVFWIKLIVGFNNYEIRPWSVSLLFFSVRLFRFCVVIWFFHPRHNGQWPPTSKDFYTRSYPLHYFLILILEKEPVFSLFNVEC